MMIPLEQIKSLIQQSFLDATITVYIDGNHVKVVVISADFFEKSPVVRHQAVYKTVAPYIHSGEIHAFSIKTYTPEEYEKHEEKSRSKI